MASSSTTVDHELVRKLMTLSKKDKKLVHSSTYCAPADPAITLRSWKMNEFKYYDVPSPFPTLARGLFSTWVSEDGKSDEGDEKGMYRIVARGYDKFFNIGEVPWTTWDTLEKHTCAPYVMTLKSNGCIIFIAALSPTKLLVTSKHSLGPVVNAPVSHAQAGENWLMKHIAKSGKSPEQLAQVLWDNNWTAVAELCDDSFEEHVLPYSPEKTGLHLHGINLSMGTFKTLLSEDVAAFAREWGLIETPFHVVHSIKEVREFSDEIAKNGNWHGDPIEGFVVRTHVAPESSFKDAGAPPYPPGSSFFFKVKYDEPYMMYRDWREITKNLLSAKGDIREAKVSRAKLRRPESELYFLWVRDEIARDRNQFKEYTNGKGIIAVRERFLKWMEARNKADDLANVMGAMSINSEQTQKFGKTIIVPISIPGCGKTSIAVALKHLFGFGHVQSDDINKKKAAPIFIRRVLEELNKHDVVIADKNNHLSSHRENLRRAVQHSSPPVRLVALHWPLEKPPAVIHRICSDRIMARGENHQSLLADAEARSHESVIWMFLSQTEELANKEVDEVVEMDFEEDLEQSLDRAIDACVRVLNLPKPSQEAVGRALAAARSYKPMTLKKDEDQKRAQDKKAAQEEKAQAKAERAPPAGRIRYYALLPELNLHTIMQDRLAQDDVPAAAVRLWKMFVKKNRVTTIPHVTLVHYKLLPAEKILWDRCHSLFLHPSPPTFEVELGHLIYDGRMIVITVKDVKVAIDPGEDTHKDATEFVSSLSSDFKNLLHITVGTRETSINAYEARALIDEWRSGKNKKIVSLPFSGVVVKGRLKGMNH
ncbi:hypothetical protein EW145_g1197 [Phellinidium pouzarii]|uniref:tRNA ligase n=1 Tax=Phellinidium pouzarii TaxID=167371 RepID=A0A4S4LFL5_9AGAM|nr:hypothetical protein EW145_g1197 [Phellinidium pouzarii]